MGDKRIEKTKALIKKLFWSWQKLQMLKGLP